MTKLYGRHRLLALEKTFSFLLFLLLMTLILLPLLATTTSPAVEGFGLLAVEHDWNERLGKLRAEALDRLFPRRVTALLEAIDPFGFGFVDYRDPYELISFITLYLPGVIFMLNVLFHSIPHVLNFLLFVPKLWFFHIPCLYSFNESPLKRVSGELGKRDDFDDAGLFFNEVTSTDPCDPINLTHITHLVYKGLVKLTEQQQA